MANLTRTMPDVFKTPVGKGKGGEAAKGNKNGASLRKGATKTLRVSDYMSGKKAKVGKGNKKNGKYKYEVSGASKVDTGLRRKVLFSACAHSPKEKEGQVEDGAPVGR